MKFRTPARSQPEATNFAMFVRSLVRSSGAITRANAPAFAPRALRQPVNGQRSMSSQEGKGKRLVLAYSGGLDTSTQLRWLADKGYEVVAFTANLGQGGGMNDEDFSGIEAKALASGAVKSYVVDLQEDFVKNYVFPIIRANAIYESRYMLGTSLARPCITKTQAPALTRPRELSLSPSRPKSSVPIPIPRLLPQVAIAKMEGCKYISHGSTGKGNDQVQPHPTLLARLPPASPRPPKSRHSLSQL